MSCIRFSKMHGLGNDYIYVNTMLYPIDNPEQRSVEWSRSHIGIGSDGLVLIGKSDVADFSMRIFNADGSEAMMCGNASRCIGKYLYEEGLTDKTVIALETLSGIKKLYLHLAEDGTVASVTVDMGIPGRVGEVILGEGYGFGSGVEVSMGNPHLVFFVDEVMKVDVAAWGARLEHHPLFPDRVNVEFAQVLPDGNLRMRVWERGSGLTEACGTGACATAVAARFTGRTADKVAVVMDGGTLCVECNPDNRHVYMTGTATRVFEGEIRVS